MAVEQLRHLSRRQLLRTLAVGASALGVAPLLAACGQEPPAAEAEPTSPPQVQLPAGTPKPETTIEVWYYDQSIGKTVAAFKSAHPTIDVKLSYGNADPGLIRLLKSGKGLPDVGVYSDASAGAIAQLGGLADLSGAPFDAAAHKGDFVQAAWDAGTNAEGKLIGLPLNVYPVTYWYRADVLAELGVESDPDKLAERITDWPALFELAKEVSGKRQGASLLPRTFFDVFLPQLAQQGGALVENAKLVIEEKGTQPAQQALLARTLKLDIPGIDSQRSLWDESMRNGNIAGLFGASSYLGDLLNVYSNLSGKWRSIVPPGGGYVQAATYFCIPTTSAKQEAAWQFISYCTSVEGQNSMLSASGSFPALRTAWADSLYDGPVAFFGGQRVYRQWAEVAQAGKMLAPTPYDAAIFDALGIAVRKVADGESEPAAALAAVEQRIAKANPGLTT